MHTFVRTSRLALLIALISIVICSCASLPVNVQATSTGTAPAGVDQTMPADQSTPTAQPSPTPEPQPIVWINEDLPAKFVDGLNIPPGWVRTEDQDQANILIDFSNPQEQTSPLETSQWVYVLAAPFKTVTDRISTGELKQAWKGMPPQDFKGLPLMMTTSTRAVLEGLLGRGLDSAVKVMDESALQTFAASGQPGWALLPFDELDPHWKVLKLKGVDPLSKTFKPENYALTVNIELSAKPGLEKALIGIKNGKHVIPPTNRDPEKMTVLMLTGTTCMVRYLALKMEENGVLYPAKDILDTLKDSDILHISNEASFYTKCPPAVPLRREQRFCSDPKYLELLTYIGTSVVELTGNHLIDWGTDPFVYTLNVYKENNLPYYGGGINQDEARKPFLIKDHGNKIALIGCNTAGPQDDWASSSQPGSARCDYDYITGQITDLKANGYLPVFTYQHIELEDYHPTSLQRVDFHHMADLGAVIVSGSQSHYPQFMVFKGDTFIHYGLGNTFFDQMMEGNRRGFIDRHVFYDGRYISTQLVPVILEDYARLRLMNDDERRAFLKDIFDASIGDRIYINPTPVPGG